MPQIRADNSASPVIATVDLPEEQVDQMMATLLPVVQNGASAMPHFVSANWFLRRPTAPGIPARVLEYSQWRSVGDRVASTATPTATRGEVRMQPLVTAGRFDNYEVDGVVSHDGLGRLDLGARSALTMIITMASHDADVVGLSARSQEDTRAFISGYPGFTAAAFHLGSRRDALVEVVQWESQDAFERAAADRKFRAHIEEGGRGCEVHVDIYDLLDTVLPSL